MATRTEQTEQWYAQRGRDLVRRFLGDRDAVLRPHEFVDWLLRLRPTVAPSTWRLYRLGAKAALEGLSEGELAARRLDEVGGAGLLNVPKGASLKVKRIPPRDFERLMALLRLSRSERASAVSDWLRAGVATGLRPVEWATARLDGDALVVRNAKSTNGRGNGLTRTLDLSGLAEADFGAVERMLDRAGEWEADGRFEAEQEACAALLRALVARHFPSAHYSLYSARHQAVANAKARLTRPEVAALAGHAVIRTAARSYGRRRSAWSPEAAPAPMPSPEEAARVDTKTFDIVTRLYHLSS